MAILIDHIQNIIQSDGTPNLILGMSGTVVTINGSEVSTSTFNTGTLVTQAVSAGYATTASLASYATTSSIATSAAYATTSSIASTATAAALAYSLVGGIGVSSLAGSSGTSVSGSTGAVTVWFNTATQVANAVSAQSATTATSAAVAYSLASTSTTQVGFAVNAFTATSAAFAYSFNTATLVANAVTAQTLASSSSFTVGFANTATHIAAGAAGMIHMQGSTGTTTFINAGTSGQLLQSQGSTASFVSTTTLQVGNALFAISATSAGYATTSSLASYATTSSIATSAAYATTSSIASTATSAALAYSLVGGIGVSSLAGSSGTSVSGSTGAVTVWFNTATQVASAVSAQSATTATSAAVAYSIVNTSTLQVGFAVSAFTATSAAIAYAVASTATLQVGSALFAVTATSAAVAYSLASTSTTQVGFAVNAFTATSAATAYSWLGGTVPNAVTFGGQVTFSGSATFVNSTSTLYTDNILEIHVPVGGMDAMWGVDDGKDIGFHFHYFKNSTDTNAALLLRNDSKYLEWFQAGDDSTSNGNNFTATTYGTFKTGSIILANTTGTSSPTTGAFTVAGGVGVGGNIYVSGVVTATTFIGNLTGTASTATAAATAYSLANTSTTQVGFAVNAFTATSAALAYAVASTSTLQVGSALFAVTATSAAIAYSLVNTSTFQAGFAVSAFTATSAAVAYSLVNTSTFQAGFAVNAFTATSAATAYNLANTTTFLVGNALNSVNATNATNQTGGAAGMIQMQSAAGVSSFINTGTVGYVLQMQTGNTATWVSTSSLGISGGGATFTGGTIPNVTTVTNYFTVYSSTSVTTRGVQEISGNADGSFLAPNNSGVMLHITGQSGQPGRLYIDGQGTSNYSAVIGRKSRGTTASPTQVLANDIVFRLGSTPYTDAAFPAISTTRLDFLADELQTVTTQGSRIEAWVTQLGTTSSSISKQMTIATSGTVIWNTFTSVSTSTGALQVAGGVGIGGALYVGGNLYTRGVQVLPANIQEFTATASQTLFTVSGGYTVGTVVVVANGIELGNADITATDGTTVTLATARNSGDIIRIKSGPASTDTGSASLKAFSIAMSVALG